ncbi:MAG: cation:proton antiporter regulatory subunit [Gaiellaceae bacterium]
MTDVEETLLPGVGARHDFTTTDGQRLGVIVHRTGVRELLIYGKDDPDACVHTLKLEGNNLHVLVELLGGTQIVERLANLQYSVEGLAIDWLSLPANSASIGATLGSTAMRTRTGVSIVAVLRGEATFPSPEPDLVFEAQDVAVVVGTPEGILQADAILQQE